MEKRSPDGTDGRKGQNMISISVPYDTMISTVYAEYMIGMSKGNDRGGGGGGPCLGL